MTKRERAREDPRQKSNAAKRGGCDEHCRSGVAGCAPSTRYASQGIGGERDTAGVLIHKVA